MKKKNARPAAPDYPSSEDIATLHALRCESAQLADQINMPVASLIAAIPLHAFHEYFISPALEGKGNPALSHIIQLCTPFSKNTADALATHLTFVIYNFFHYYAFPRKLHPFVAHHISRIFPNGISYNRNTHPAHELEASLGTSQEVKAQIEALKALVEQQKKTVSRGWWLSLLAPFIAGIAILIGNRYIKKNKLKLNVQQQYRNSHYLVKLGAQIGAIQIKTSLANFFYRKYDNWNTPKQLKNFTNRLKFLSCSTAPYRNVDETNERQRGIFTSHLETDENDRVIFRKEKGKDYQTIPKHIYLIELHRILLEEKIPVYLASGDAIYIGFTELSEKRAKRTRNHLHERLNFLSIHDTSTKNKLDQHNSAANKAGLKHTAWQIHLEIDKNGQYKTLYYLDKNKAYLSYINKIRHYAESCDTDTHLEESDEIIRIYNENTISEILEPALSDFKSKKSKQEYKRQQEHLKQEANRRAQEKNANASRAKPAEYHEPLVSEQALHKPIIIDFGDGYSYSHSQAARQLDEDGDDDMDYRPKQVYPLSIAWLSKGTAYGAIAPDVYSSLKNNPHCTQRQIIARLSRGKVHGQKQVGAKNKQGSVGIQSTSEPYTDYFGNAQAGANHLKLKFENRFRIFGHPARKINIDGKDRILYLFDGPDLTH